MYKDTKVVLFIQQHLLNASKWQAWPGRWKDTAFEPSLPLSLQLLMHRLHRFGPLSLALHTHVLETAATPCIWGNLGHTLWGKWAGHDILGNTENPENMECSVNIYCFKLKRAVSLKGKQLDLVLRIEQEKHGPSAFSWEMNFTGVTVIVYCLHWSFWLGWDLISTSVLTVSIITSLCVTFGKNSIWIRSCC